MGYVLTIVAIEISSYGLLVVGRAISGFTAGNQPITQAALVDISRSDEERTRNMGRMVAALALGLVAGPLIAGLLSAPEVLGAYASLQLPFICATALVALSLLLVVLFYHDARTVRRKIDFGVSEVFVNLWRIRHRPTIIKLAVVFFFFELGLNAFFIFLNDYAIARFGFDTLQNSALMIVFGVTMAFVSGLLVGPLSARFRKIPLVAGSVVLMAVSLTAFLVNGNAALSYVLLVPIVVGFAVGYPTQLALFSASAGADEQGWVMGVTIALFTLGSGMIALAGGAMMALDARLPFMVGVAGFLVALVLIATLWRHDDVKALDQNQGK